jgi:hypothetical protein
MAGLKRAERKGALKDKGLRPLVFEIGSGEIEIVQPHGAQFSATHCVDLLRP